MPRTTVTCPQCSAQYQVDNSHLGRRARCNRCGEHFIVSRFADLETKTVDASVAAKDAETARVEQLVPEIWKLGDVILGVYEVKRLNPADKRKHYAEGGVGLVYRVHHRGWDLDLAVKCPKREAFRAEQGALDFECECETWIDLGLHPNIVTCYYVRRLGGIPRIFAEFVDGGSLREWIRSRRLYEGGRRESLLRILDIAIQFAWGLHYAHGHGVIHQDVKPANVMMQNGVPKVTDFGLVRARVAAGEITRPDPPYDMLVSWAGMTPGYCSPEQARAAVQLESGVPAEYRTKLTHRTDIWSWGVSVFEMFRGQPPCPEGGHTAADAFIEHLYKGPPDEAIPEVPDGVSNLLQRCFQDNPDDRPADMEEVARELIEVYREAAGHDYFRQEPAATELKADGLNNRAVSMLDLGKQDEAARFFEEAWHWHPWQSQVTHNRSLLMWRTGRITDVELVGHLEDLVATRAETWEPAYSLGQVQLERGEIEPAIQALERAISLGGPPEVRALVERAQGMAAHTPHCVRSLRAESFDLDFMFQSPDDRLALSRSDDDTVRIWDMATGHPVLSFEIRPEESIDNVTSADGAYCLKAGDEGRIQLWDRESDTCSAEFQQVLWGPATNAATPDGRWTLSGGEDYELVLRDAATGEVRGSFHGHTGRVNSISLTADSTWALSGSSDKTLRLWEVETGRCLRTLKGHTHPVNRVFISSDGTWAFSASTGTTVRLWNLGLLCDATRRYTAPMLLCRITSSEEAGEAQASFASLAARAREAIHAGRPDEALKLAREVRNLSGYGVARQSLDLWNMVGSYCRRVRLLDAWCARTLVGHSGEVNAVALTANGNYAISGGWDKTLRLWDTATGRTVRSFEGHGDCVRGVALNGDGRLALSGGWDRTVRLWDVATGQCRRVFSGHGNGIESVAISADGRLALSGSWDRTLRLWDTTTGACLQVLKGHTAYVNSVCLSNDGRIGLSGSEDNTLRVWDTAGGSCLLVLEGHGGWIHDAQLAVDGLRAVSAGKDATLRVWNLDDGQCLKVLQGHTGPALALGLSADGRWAVSGGKSGSARVWDLVDGKCVRTLEGHTDAVHAVSISADGRWSLSGSKDGTLRLWELDWEYEFPGWSDWNEDARQCLTDFVVFHRRKAEGGKASGKPLWSDYDFRKLLVQLQYRGFGWLRPDGVRRQLELMTGMLAAGQAGTGTGEQVRASRKRGRERTDQSKSNNSLQNDLRL